MNDISEALVMKFLKSRMHALLAFVVVLLLATAGVQAQTNYGTVRGEVKDVQGAVIPNAKITLTNQDTKVAKTGVANGAGIYEFGGVDPGNYTVTIFVPGFKTYDTKGNVVSLGAVTTVDAVLTIGGANETVEVAADTVQLNTANASAEQIFTAQQVQDLPNLGRDPFMFVQLDANVVTLGDPRYVRAEDSSGVSDVSVAGAPGNTNSYNVDGIPVSTSSGGATFVVSPDAISEAKVQGDDFDASIGRTGGGVFVNTLKVGSSTYHGTLYGETRQTPWSANVWFNPSKTPTPTDQTYLYSGAIGGPLFPKFITNKFRRLDNTFFWLTEEGYRQGQPLSGSTQTYYVPTIAERTGDFTADAPLYDPTVAGRTTTFAQECGSNVIPGSVAATKAGEACGGKNLANGIGFSMANAFPLPLGPNATATFLTSPTATSSNPNGDNFFASGVGFKTRADEFIGKVEHQFFPWWTSQFSYLHSGVQEPQSTFANSYSLYASGNDLEDRKFDSTAWNNTFTINSSTLLTVAYGYNRYWSAFPYRTQGFSFTNGFAYNGTNYGFAGAFPTNVPLTSYPTVTISGLTAGSYSAPGLGGAFGGYTPQASHNLVAILSKSIKKHDLRFGYTYRGFSYFTNPPNTPGSFTFNGEYTDSTGAVTSGANGTAAIADMEVGLPSALSETLYAGPFINRIVYNSVWAQDDYRLSEKLTVNLGIRYEFEEGQHEENNKFNVGFNPAAPVSYVNSQGVTQNLTGGLVFAGVGGAPTHCCQNPAKFSPRIGVAYQVFKNTVMHAGYGFYYAPVGITTSYNQGYSQVTTTTPTAPNAFVSGQIAATTAVGATGCLTTPFFQTGTGATCGGGLLQPSANSLGALTGFGGALTVIDAHRGYPLVQQYMMDAQQKLPGDFIVTLSYIGTHSSNFAEAVNINQMPDSFLASAYASNATLTTGVAGTNPYYAATIGGLPSTGVAGQKSLPLGQTYLPFPYYGSISLSKSIGFGWYNSVALKVEKRVTTGLTLLTTYTHASNWDNLYGSSIGSQTTTTSGPQNNNNLGAEYARSLDDVPNRFTLAVTDVLPVGKGKKYLGNPQGFAGHALDAVVGGWQVNYEHVITNGVPLTVTQTDLSTTFGPTGTGGSVQRPTLVGDVHAACYSGSPQTRLGGSLNPNKAYLNAAAFVATPAYHYGNTPRTLPCAAPGSDTATASLNKYLFTFHDRFKLQFRIEALNLFNTPQFATPSTTYTVSKGATPTAATTVGTGLFAESSQAGFGRVIQMGGRLTF
jgi:trimeric autotransporter adhesin